MPLRSSVPTRAKRAVWNLKYRLLGYPEMEAPASVVAYLRDKVADSSTILELGCGRGALLRGLRAAGCASHYCGVDISHYAIEQARAWGDQRSAWVASDIESFRSPYRWDVILMIESVYYVAPEQIAGLLARLGEMLTENGFVLVRIHDTREHADSIEAMRRAVPGLETVDPALFSLTREAIRRALAAPQA